MTPQELKAACLALPKAREEFPFDETNSVFKVEDKMFAISRLAASPLRVSLKCDPDLALHPRATYPGHHRRLPPQQAALEHHPHRRFGTG